MTQRQCTYYIENDNQTTGVCLLDISKCFDTISHHILLQKLSMYGIKHTELEWFSAYLDKRKQAVLCHNKLSSFVDITSGVPQGSVLGPFLFLLFINDISNFTTDGCVTNLFADDAMIYASGDSVSEVQLKLQSCLLNISKWYRENCLKINSDKSKVMLVGSKAQLKSLNVDDFILKYEGTPLELVENAKYLGMSINSDISWDFHVQRLCQNMYYHLSLLRRLRPILPKDLLLQVYKSYIQPRLDYGITLYACSTQKNIDLVQRVQNHAARLITGNFDYINCRGIDLIKSLNLYTIRERRDYFLTILMFKAIHGIAPTYLSDRIVMNFDVNGYDTRGSDMDLSLLYVSYEHGIVGQNRVSTRCWQPSGWCQRISDPQCHPCCCCFALARISRVAHSLGGGAHAGLLGGAFQTGLSFVESFFYSHYDICCFSQFSYIIPEYVIVGNTQASSVCHFRAFLDDVFLGFLFRLAKSALVIRFGSFFEIVFYW